MPAYSNRSPESRSRLGRGLAALLGDAGDESTSLAPSSGITHLPIESLRSSAKNPRQRFDDSELRELSESIKLRGIIQPILVRPVSNVHDTFEIIAGERRWRASQQAGMHRVPVIVLDVGERDALELAIIENVQRTDLNALEEAAAYSRLGVEFGYNHNDIARVVGKSRSHVANTIRLTNLPSHTRELLSAGAISAGHGRALLPLEDPDSVADRIVASGLTVRDVEKLSRTPRAKGNEQTERAEGPDVKAIENRLALALGAPVQIKQNNRKFNLRIKFSNLDQLISICDKFLVL